MMPFSQRNAVILKERLTPSRSIKPFGLINMYVDCNIVAHVLANDNIP